MSDIWLLIDRTLLEKALAALDAGLKLSPQSEFHDRLRAALEQEAEVPLVVGCGGNNTTGSLPQAQENLSVFSDVTLEDGSRWIVTVFGGGGSGTREKNT